MTDPNCNPKSADPDGNIGALIIRIRLWGLIIP